MVHVEPNSSNSATFTIFYGEGHAQKYSFRQLSSEFRQQTLYMYAQDIDEIKNAKSRQRQSSIKFEMFEAHNDSE